MSGEAAPAGSEAKAAEGAAEAPEARGAEEGDPKVAGGIRARGRSDPGTGPQHRHPTDIAAQLAVDSNLLGGWLGWLPPSIPNLMREEEGEGGRALWSNRDMSLKWLAPSWKSLGRQQGRR